jgi:hypothetical protein
VSAGLLEHCSPNESALYAEVLELGRRLGKKKGRRRVSYAFQERATSPLVADPHLREALFRVIPRVNLSVKVTALTLLLRPHAPDRGRADLAARLRQLLRRARDVGAHLHIDADADLDEVVPAILGSAFGFAGQKCAAASRLRAPA